MSSLLSRRQMLGLTATSLLFPALSAQAAPIPYQLMASQSSVGFGVDLGNDRLVGSMPVRAADLALDFNDVSRSKVSVTIDAANVRMGVFFATDAVRSADLLDVARHPTISFRSRAIRAGASAAEAVVQGDVTIKGVTAPVTLNTVLTQERATVGQDNPPLTLNLSGAVNRLDFGLTAFQQFVGPRVTLDIRAQIRRA